MSFPSYGVRRATLAGAAVLAGACALPSSASALTSSHVAYNCVYPLVDGQPLEADVSTTLPATVPFGAAAPAPEISVTARALGDTWRGLDLITARTFSATAFVATSVTIPGGATQQYSIPVSVASTTVPLDDPGVDGLTIPASGVGPSVTYPYSGTSTWSIDGLRLNVRAIADDGTPIVLGAATDSDGDPGTFDVRCSGPRVQLAEIAVSGNNPPPVVAADGVAPMQPGVPVASELTTASATLTWAPSTDNVGVTAYDVYQDGVKVQSVLGTTATLVGLSPSTAYAISVVARDAAGNSSAPSGVVTARTPAPAPTVVKYTYDVAGSTTIKTLSSGVVPVRGVVNASLTLGTGAITGTTVIADTSGTLKALGFLPISAVIGFTEIGGTSGSLVDGVINATTKQDVRLRSAKAFGINLVSGACHTTSPSLIALKSAPGFLPTAGGQVTGAYAVAPLTGCGALDGLVSVLTAGKGNTLSLKLTPRN